MWEQRSCEGRNGARSAPLCVAMSPERRARTRGQNPLVLSNFLLSPFQCTVTHCRSCKRLREFEEIEISRHSCRGKHLRLLPGFRQRILPLLENFGAFIRPPADPRFVGCFLCRCRVLCNIFYYRPKSKYSLKNHCNSFR